MGEGIRSRRIRLVPARSFGWTHLAPLLCGLSVGISIAARAADSVPAERGIQYTHLTRTDPRPLQIHVLHIDLREPSLQLTVMLSPDPDGDGPAETTLTSPLEHASRGQLAVAVNANAWSMISTNPAAPRPRYVAGAPCDPHGWVVVEGLQRSAPQSGYWSLWLDPDGRARIGNRGEPAPRTRWAVAGFGGLLRDGKVLPAPSEVRHPRTAAGLDRDGRRLTLVVVDGRQPGYSEGMSERELAELLAELGCFDALNLDGGGSSVMLRRSADATHQVLNRPSDFGGPRPIPVLLGARVPAPLPGR